MRNLRSFYSAPIATFLNQTTSEILGIIHLNDISAETTIQQSNTWEIEVEILKDQLRGLDGRVIFEYTIPRWASAWTWLCCTKTSYSCWSSNAATPNTEQARMIRFMIMRWICATFRKRVTISCWCRSWYLRVLRKLKM